MLLYMQFLCNFGVAFQICIKILQGIVDEQPEKKFILSGCSNFALLRKVSQALAGRSGVFELMPLSIEVKSAMTYSPSFEKALLKVNECVNPPVDKHTIVYAGTLEDNKGDIRLLNYLNL